MDKPSHFSVFILPLFFAVLLFDTKRHSLRAPRSFTAAKNKVRNSVHYRALKNLQLGGLYLSIKLEQDLLVFVLPQLLKLSL